MKALALLAALIAGAARAQEALTGLTAPALLVELRAPLSAPVVAVLVAEGEHVAKGDALIRLDDALQAARLARAELAEQDRSAERQAQARLDAAKARAGRIARAARRGGAHQWEADEAALQTAVLEAERDAARAAIARAAAETALERAALARYTLRAPFDGVVLKLDARPGALADPATPLLTLADMSRMEARFFAPATRAAALAETGAARARLGPPVDRETAMTLRSIDWRIEPSSGTVRMVYSFDNSALTAPAGVAATLLAEPAP